MLLKDIFEVPTAKIFIYTFYISASIFPGTLFLFIYKPEVFTTLPFLTLLLLIISVTAPFLLINTLLAFQVIDEKEQNHDYTGLLLGCIFNYLVWIITLASYYLFRCSLGTSIKILLISEIVIILVFIIGIIGINQEKKKRGLEGQKNNK